MKGVVRFVGSLVMWLVIASMGAQSLYADCGVPLEATVGVLLIVTVAVAASAGKGIGDVMRCETVNVVEWARIIIKHLFKDNAFLAKCVRADEYVVKNTAVVIPQPGALPTVIKNNNSFPMTAVQRADSVVMYPLNTYVTTPTFITLDELEAISYDKTESVYDDHFKILVQTCADDQLINWGNGLPGATNVVYTTGAATGNLEIGQGGFRATCTWQDVKKLQRLMNKANVAEDNRVLIMESNMFDQFTDSLAATSYRDALKEYDPTTGKLGSRTIYGFEVLQRSSVLQAATALDINGNLAVNALGAALGVTDNIGCLAYQKQSLELAMGMVHVFSRENDPLYTGDIRNVRIKAGGRVRRADNAGVYALMQGTAVGN